NIATFVNSEGLKEVLPGFFEQSEDSGQPQVNIPGVSGTGLLQHGYLETPEGQRVETTTLLLVGLCSLVAWLAWEVRCLRLSLAGLGVQPSGELTTPRQPRECGVAAPNSRRFAVDRGPR